MYRIQELSSSGWTDHAARATEIEAFWAAHALSQQEGALSGLYPPGSTIKTLVALSALENGIVRPLDTFRCKGKIELYGEKFHCWEKKGHGIVNLRKGIKDLAMYIFTKLQENLV